MFIRAYDKNHGIVFEFQKSLYYFCPPSLRKTLIKTLENKTIFYHITDMDGRSQLWAAINHQLQ
jgi:hypothetical protein